MTATDPTHTGFGGLLGQRSPLAGHATVVAETDDPREALVAAGLDWTVSTRPLWFTGRANKSKPVKVPRHFAVVRDDEETLLGTVTEGWTPVQNLDAFEWARGLGTFTFAGALRGGRSIYLGVRLDRVAIADEDHDLYLVLWNGHDGRKSLGGLTTPIRLRCTNQMRYATSTAVARFTARHTARVMERAEEAKTVLGLVRQELAETQRVAERLVATPVTVERARQVLERALPRRTELIAGVLADLETTDTLDDDQRGTGWGLVNAVTEYFEWRRPSASRESALQTTLDGVGARAVRAVTADLLAGA